MHSAFVVGQVHRDWHVVLCIAYLELAPAEFLIVSASQLEVSGIPPQEHHELFSNNVVDVFIEILLLDAVAFHRHAADSRVAHLPLAQFSWCQEEVAHVAIVLPEALVLAQLGHLELHEAD